MRFSKLGAVCVPIPTKYREPEVLSLTQRSTVSRPGPPSFEGLGLPVVWSRGVADGYGFAGLSGEGVDAAGGPEDPVIMMFTSGTTSAAKGVVLRNYNVCHAAMVYARLMGTTSEDRCLIPIPIYHVTGLIALLVQFVYVGARTYLHRLFDARRVLTCVRDDEITYLHGSPTSFAELLPLRDEFPELPSVRAMLSGSSYEPLPAMRAFHEWMPTATFQVVYGMTETASPALLFPLDSPTSVYAGATGKPVPASTPRSWTSPVLRSRPARRASSCSAAPASPRATTGTPRPARTRRAGSPPATWPAPTLRAWSGSSTARRT